MRAALLGCLAAAPIAAQTSPPPISALRPYEGHYEYHDGGTLDLVAASTPGGARLVAVIDEAKYPLRYLGKDRFLNGLGDTIPFLRSPDGRVRAFVEQGVTFRRMTTVLAPLVAASVVPRPPGPDGEPAPYVYRVPPGLGDGFDVGDVADVGLDTAIAGRIVRRVEDRTYPDVDGVLVYRRGRLVLEEYFYGYDAWRPHQLRSATKSVVSALVGVAVDRGALALSTPVLAALPYGPPSSYGHPDPRKAAITLGDLLSMRSGLACDDWDPASPGNETKIYGTADWVKTVLDLPMAHDPGTVARYCSAGVLAAGRMVERAVGTPLPAFARRELFGPVGIRPDDVRWDFTLARSNARTFADLALRPRDMLKLGVLFLQEGRWKGRQLLSADWVRRSTTEVARLGSRGYAYGWWHQYFMVRTPDGMRHVDALNASGNGGQKIYILPELDLVAVFTGSSYNSDRDSAANTIMGADLLPALLGSR